MPLYHLNHCRDAIYLALKSLQLPKGSRVGLTVFNCQTVMSAVVAAECCPVFLDITPDYLLDVRDLNKKHRESVLQALIVTHFYGKINEMSNIRMVVSDIPIIEDCAHAWNYFDLHVSQSIISYQNHFYVTSVDFGKCLNLGSGGLLYTEDVFFAKALDKLYDNLSQVSYLQNFVLNFTIPIKRIIYGSFLTKTFVWRSTRKFRHRHLNTWENPLKMSPVVFRRLKKLNWHKNYALCVHPEYQNCLYWASEMGYLMGYCPITESLL